MARERSEAARRTYRFSIGVELPSWLVFLDESSLDTRVTYRLNGWSWRGQRARVRSHFVRGNRCVGASWCMRITHRHSYSILPAITIDGMLYSELRRGAFDGDSFLAYLERLLPLMSPYPGPRSVLVMDNCAIHHVPGVAELCESYGVKLVYLPPYSPDLNPIEEFFSALKADIRRHGASFRSAIEQREPGADYMWLYEALDRVASRNSACGWFRHSGYVGA